MACNQLNGIPKECGNNLGGVRRLWLIRLEEIASLQIINNILLQAQVQFGNGFVEYVCPLYSTTYNVTYNVDQQGVIEYTHSIDFRISKRLPSKHVELRNLAEGYKKFVAIVENNNHEYWLVGYPFGLTLETFEGGSGTNLADGTNYQLSLQGTQPNIEIAVNPNNISQIIPGELVG